MMCVSSVTYQVILEDELLGPIKPSRGLRQGDLLSPYLFILYSEGLSVFMEQKKRCGHIYGCRVSGSAPYLTLLSFLFYRAMIREVEIFQNVLKLYERTSG